LSAQAELNFAPPHEAPRVSPADVQAMIATLRGRKWVSAADLGAATETQKRRLRAIASASGGEIISGQKGYRLTREAEHAEYWHARDRLSSQSEDMKRRVAEIDCVWHNR